MPNQPEAVVFEVAGKADVIERKGAASNLGVASLLNDQAVTIADEIRDKIRAAVPPGMTVDVELDFTEGSLAWFGVVSILDWMGRLSGAGSFVEYLARLVRLVTTRVVRRRAQSFAQLGNLSTAVTLLSGTEVPVSDPTKVALPDRWFLLLILLNTLLLGVILALLLRRGAT